MTLPAPATAGVPEPLAILPDGSPLLGCRLCWGDELEAVVLDYGAMLGALTVPTHTGRVQVLQSVPDVATLVSNPDFHGVTVGPVANRISGAAFTVDGVAHRMAPNDGQNLLHSGAAGWSHRAWRFVEASPTHCVLALDLPPEGAFAGAAAHVTFALTAPDTLEITWAASVAAPTPIILTQHLYFDLSGGAERTVEGHELRLAADCALRLGPGLIPTGEIVPVAGAASDFRTRRRIGDALAQGGEQIALAGGIDQYFVIDPGHGEALSLRSPATGVELHITTDQPGLQLYTSQHLQPPFRPFSALAIEPQDYPDAVNRPEFPSVIVRPGAPYRRFARYRFAAGEPGVRA